MTIERLLIWIIIIEGMALLFILVLFLGHALLSKLRGKRNRSALSFARTAIMPVLEGSRLALSDKEILRRMPTPLKIDLISDLASKIGSGHHEQIRMLADELGLIVQGRALCRSRWWWRRLYGARLLTMSFDGKDIVPPLLKDRSPFVRAQAAEWASENPSNEIIQGLLTLLSDPAEICRFTAKDSLVRIGAQVGGPLGKYLSSSSSERAEEALDVAVWVAAPGLSSAALKLSGNASPGVRAKSVCLLGSLGGEESIEKIVDLLDDPVPGVRASGAQALRKLEYWPAAARLAALLEDEEWIVRREAGLALRALGAPGILFLRHALSSRVGVASDMARQMLSLSDNKSA